MSPVPNFVFLHLEHHVNIPITGNLCQSLYNRFRDVRLRHAQLVLDIHGVGATSGSYSDDDQPKMQATLCKDVRQVATTQAGGLVNFDPRSQPGAVTKLIDGVVEMSLEWKMS